MFEVALLFIGTIAGFVLAMTMNAHREAELINDNGLLLETIEELRKENNDLVAAAENPDWMKDDLDGDSDNWTWEVRTK